jgi:hypothetical protein
MRLKRVPCSSREHKLLNIRNVDVYFFETTVIAGRVVPTTDVIME